MASNENWLVLKPDQAIANQTKTCDAQFLGNKICGSLQKRANYKTDLTITVLIHFQNYNNHFLRQYLIEMKIQTENKWRSLFKL